MKNKTGTKLQEVIGMNNEKERVRYCRKKRWIDDTTWRLKVPKGWLVGDCIIPDTHPSVASSLIFISDPNHEWTLQK